MNPGRFLASATTGYYYKYSRHFIRKIMVADLKYAVVISMINKTLNLTRRNTARHCSSVLRIYPDTILSYHQRLVVFLACELLV